MMWSEAQEEEERMRRCLLLAASGGVAGEDEASCALAGGGVKVKWQVPEPFTKGGESLRRGAADGPSLLG